MQENTPLSYVVNNMDVGVLEKQGAKASAAIPFN